MQYYNNYNNYNNASSYYASHPYPYSMKPRQSKNQNWKQPMMSPIQAFKSYWFNMVNFSDTAPRSELWWNMIIQFFLCFGLSAIESHSISLNPSMILLNLLLNPTILFAISFILLIPNLSLVCRRLHDIGYSGWWQLVLLFLIGLPYVGAPIALLGLLMIGLTPSEPNSSYEGML